MAEAYLGKGAQERGLSGIAGNASLGSNVVFVRRGAAQDRLFLTFFV